MRQLVRLAGFRYACTTRPRPLVPGNRFDRFTVPRLDIATLTSAPVETHA